MHDNVLSADQIKTLPLLAKFFNELGLVGGTAIALQIGHRRSMDFDFATDNDLKSEKIKEIIRNQYKIEKTIIDDINELTIIVNSVKFTFFKYPFKINFDQELINIIRMPDILTLAAMKAYALGRRAKWKDYVDLFFILKDYLMSDLTTKAREIYKGEFSEKLFREQLSYFKDIDYSEKIDYLEGFEKTDSEIKNTLTEISLQK